MICKLSTLFWFAIGLCLAAFLPFWYFSSTAMGLFAAIPAVIAYNRFANKVEKLESHYINFMEEFANILHRQAATQIEAKANVSA